LSSGFGGGGNGEIRYIISVDDSQAIGKLQGVGQQLQTLGQNSETATQQVSEVSPALDNVAKSSDEVQQSSQRVAPSIAQVGTAVAFAATSIISLVQQYTSLKKAQNAIDKAEITHRATLANNKILYDKYTKAVKEHGKNSQEAKDALEKYTRGVDKSKQQVEKLSLMQESLSQRMLSFAISVVPTTIGVVSGLAQTFQILGNGRGGSGGMRGVLSLIGRFGGPLIILGGILLAIKLNLFGFRDALDAVGKALGDAVPAIKPALNAIRDLGVVIGLVPGNADEAQKRLKKFGGSVIQWGKDVASAIGRIFNKLKSGDIKGALDDIKASVKNVIIKIGNTKINYNGQSLTVDQWAASLPILLKYKVQRYFSQSGTGDKGSTKGPVDLFLDFNKFFNMQIEPADPFADWSQKNIIKPWTDMVNNVANFIQNTPLFAGVDILSSREGQDIILTPSEANQFFADNVATPLGKAWGNMVTTWQGFIKDNPIMQKLVVGDIMGAAKLAVGDVNNWLADHIATPIGGGWANLVNTVTKFLTDNPVMKEIIKTADNIMGKIGIAANVVETWFDKNVGKPIRDAWTNTVKAVQKWIMDNPILGPAFKAFTDAMNTLGDAQSNIDKYNKNPLAIPQSFDSGVGPGNGPVCFDDSGRQMPCSTNKGNPTARAGPGLGGKTDFRNLQIAMQGANQTPMFDIMAKQIVQITANLNVFAKVIVQVTKDISVYAKAIITTVTDHNTFAKTIVTIVKDINTYAKTVVTLTKDISVYAKAIVTTVKDHNTFAKTIVTIIKDNNTYAKTIVTVTKDINQQAKATVQQTKDNNQLAKTLAQLTKNNNTYAKTIVTVTKDINQAARATSQWESDNKSLASSLGKVASAAKNAANAIRSVPSGGGSGGFNFGSAQGGLHTTLGSDTLILAHAGERVDIGHGSNSEGNFGVFNGTVNLHISGNDIVNERNLSKKIRLEVGRDMDKFG